MPESMSQASTIVWGVALLLSLMATFLAVGRRLRGKPLLEYEPRQRVPWGAGAILIPLMFVLLPLLQWIGTLFARQFEVLDQNETPFDPSEFIRNGIFNSVVMIGFALLTLLGLALLLNADARDLGLPRQARQLVRDIAIGCCGCLVALLPIYLLHSLLMIVFEPQQQHQLIEQLQQHRSPQMLLVGVAMAVFAAPIFEEIVFRLLLQGYLERHEDELLGFRQSERAPLVLPPSTEPENEPPRDSGRAGSGLSCSDLPHEGATLELNQLDVAEASRPGLLFGLPHGRAPVLISGTAFGLAHLEHGVSALPLVLFGIVLGYLYQRTHRLAPSIAAHMLFNAFTMLLLWLEFE